MGAGNQIAAREERFYTVKAQLTAATGASTTTTPAVQIGSQPFLWEELGAYWNDTNGQWDIRILDNGADKAFSAEKIPVEAYVGSPDRGTYPLRKPYQFGGGSSIMVEATNNGSGTDTLKLAFIGRRLPLVV